VATPFLVSAKGGSDFKPAPMGVHVGLCFQLIDLGTVVKTFKNKKSGKDEDKNYRSIRIAWELPDALMEEGEGAGKPFVVFKTYGASIGEKSHLAKDLVSWRGKPFTTEEKEAFSLDKVVGRACFLNIIHEPSKDGSKTYANIASIMAIPPGTAVPAPVNKPVIFSLDNYDGEVFEALPEWLQEQIAQSKEFKEAGRTLKKDDEKPAGVPQGVDPGDVPFN
jgi:hypothetical protein